MDAAGVAVGGGLHDLDGEDAADQATQRGGAPELLVVATAAVEADDEVRRADALLQVIDVGRQVEAAALFAGFDEHHAAVVGDALLLERGDGGERGVGGVTVVGAAAAIELVALAHGDPRALALVPTLHLRLLVAVPVKQRRAVVATAAEGRDLDEDHRRALLDAHDLHGHVLQRMLGAPATDVLDRRVEVSVLGPLRIEVRAERRDADVRLELGDDRVVEAPIDERAHCSGLQRGHACGIDVRGRVVQRCAR